MVIYNTDIIENALKSCLPTYNLVSVLFSACKCQLLLKYPWF